MKKAREKLRLLAIAAALGAGVWAIAQIVVDSNPVIVQPPEPEPEPEPTPEPPPAGTVAPTLFSTDIQSGPKTGGENNKGVWVTIYGANFGASKGTSTVTVGGGAVDNCPVWGATWLWYQKIVCQLGASVATGNIVVTVGGQASNTLPFTVRSGNIYCVATTGSDLNTGTCASPWASLLKARGEVVAGDTVYVKNGVSQVTADDFNACFWLGDINSNTAGSPVAFLTYPGATATIGSTNGADCIIGIRGYPHNVANNYIVIGGFTLRGGLEAVGMVGLNNWRIVGNDMSCPNGSGQDACLTSSGAQYLYVYGNYVHNVGDTSGTISKVYHALYFTTDTVHVWVGWNLIDPNPTHSTTSGACRGIQFYSTGGSDQFDLHVFGNTIRNTICDGINFATVTGALVEAYNNVLYHVGTGPDPNDGQSNYSCFLVGGGGTDPVNIYNNTCYDAGARGNTDSGAITPGGPSIVLRNNVFMQLTGEDYISPNGNETLLSGTHNLWYGVGSAPGQTTFNVNANPLFNNASAGDFHLQTSSPAKDGGNTITAASPDHDGVGRPQNATYGLGALEEN